MDDGPHLKRANELIDMIARNDTKGCPDPVGGGCIGNYCTRCAVGELRAVVREFGARVDQLKRVR